MNYINEVCYGSIFYLRSEIPSLWENSYSDLAQLLWINKYIIRKLDVFQIKSEFI